VGAADPARRAGDYRNFPLEYAHERRDYCAGSRRISPGKMRFGFPERNVA
jgi:hypothetical protein